MKIQINYNKINYTILTEPSSYTLIKHKIIKEGRLTKKKNIGNIKEEALGYYMKLSNALNAIIKEEFSYMEEDVSITEYIERYEKALQELRKQVDVEDK